MSFFKLSEGQLSTNGSFQVSQDIEPMPKDTQVKACIDEVKWDEYNGERYISARWQVLAPKQFANRKIFQKIKVEESDVKKRDKAIQMLAAIDANCGGKLMSAGIEPTDALMQKNLLMKPMVLLLDVWDMNGKKGNWIKAVSGSGKAEEAAPKPEPKPQPQTQADHDFDDDIFQ
jgi:hypothetical protein